jgi:hypothetical protein
MGMFSKSGSWWYSSKADPRWNMEGRVAVMMVMCGVPEADEALAAKKKELGEEPPADLVFGCMKD